ncbi:hypothetical protein BASA81_017599 [Batrachochytrium salamandrivorans]|nr:hypothetical protein BASA81_017599 [Batrachochytrium salamandrivorans]
MDQAIRIDNRIFERKRSSSITLDHSDAIHLLVSLFFAANLSSTKNDLLITLIVSKYTNFCPTTATPVQQRQTTDDMDIDFARRGPLTTAERQQRLVKDSALFAVSQDTSKLLVPDPTLALAHAKSKQLKWKAQQ